MAWSASSSSYTVGQSHLPGLRDHTQRAQRHLTLITMDRGRALGLWDPGRGARGAGQKGEDRKCESARSLPLMGVSLPEKGEHQDYVIYFLILWKLNIASATMPQSPGKDRAFSSGEEGRPWRKKGGVLMCRSGWWRGLLLSFPERLAFRGMNWKWPCRAINHARASCQPANPAARVLPASQGVVSHH